MNRPKLTIRSGGQTGCDRAALDAAIELGIPHSGWCPRGRLAEDGRISSVYDLQETRTAFYRERTRLNVEDSDATVIFSRLPLRGGTKLTGQFCKQFAKPFVIIDPSGSIENASRQLIRFVEAHRAQVLNVAGPRATTAPRIYDFTKAVVTAALRPNRERPAARISPGSPIPPAPATADPIRRRPSGATARPPARTSG